MFEVVFIHCTFNKMNHIAIPQHRKFSLCSLDRFYLLKIIRANLPRLTVVMHRCHGNLIGTLTGYNYIIGFLTIKVKFRQVNSVSVQSRSGDEAAKPGLQRNLVALSAFHLATVLNEKVFHACGRGISPSSWHAITPVHQNSLVVAPWTTPKKREIEISEQTEREFSFQRKRNTSQEPPSHTCILFAFQPLERKI